MSTTDLATVALPISLANVDELVAGAATAEEQVELGQSLVLLSDAVNVRTSLAIGDLANRYAPAGQNGGDRRSPNANIVSPGGDYAEEAAANYKAQFQRSQARVEMLREFAEAIGLAPETVRRYALVAAKFSGNRLPLVYEVSISVLMALASTPEPHTALTELVEEHPDPTRRQAREFAAAGFDARQAAATNTRQAFNPPIDPGSQLDDEIKAERAENAKLDRERAEHEARQQQREEVRLNDTDTLIQPLPDTRKVAGGKAQFGNWLISDLVETAEELVGAWEALAPDDRIKAKVLRILEPITRA